MVSRNNCYYFDVNYNSIWELQPNTLLDFSNFQFINIKPHTEKLYSLPNECQSKSIIIKIIILALIEFRS